LAYRGRRRRRRCDDGQKSGRLPGEQEVIQGLRRAGRVLAEPRPNSGIYFRCLDPKKITDRTCYEANIFDERKDPSYGTGAITRYVEVNPMPKAGEKWNTFEITVKGRDITVVLDGKETAKLRNGMFDEGPIVLQHGQGTIKFRKVQVKPL